MMGHVQKTSRAGSRKLKKRAAAKEIAIKIPRLISKLKTVIENENFNCRDHCSSLFFLDLTTRNL
jgi:hypothetical protein